MYTQFLQSHNSMITRKNLALLEVFLIRNLSLFSIINTPNISNRSRDESYVIAGHNSHQQDYNYDQMDTHPDQKDIWAFNVNLLLA